MLLIGTSILLWKEPSEGKLVFAFIIACRVPAVMLFLSGMRRVAFMGQKTVKHLSALSDARSSCQSGRLYANMSAAILKGIPGGEEVWDEDRICHA